MYVKLKNINKTFGNHNEWNDLSFVIEKGKLIGFLGQVIVEKPLYLEY